MTYFLEYAATIAVLVLLALTFVVVMEYREGRAAEFLRQNVPVDELQKLAPAVRQWLIENTKGPITRLQVTNAMEAVEEQAKAAMDAQWTAAKEAVGAQVRAEQVIALRTEVSSSVQQGQS